MRILAEMHSVAVVWVAAWAAAGSADELRLPPGGREMVVNPDETVPRFSARDETIATSETVEVQGMPFRRALRVTVHKRPDVQWHVVAHAETRGAIRKGDVLLLSFHLRGLASADEPVRVGVHVQRNRPPYTQVATVRGTAGSKWRHIVKPFIARRPLGEGESNISIHMGYAPQKLEIGGLRLINYGPDRDVGKLPRTRIDYGGRSPDAAWRKAAAERIERHRKAELTVAVTGADGRAVRGAKVRARMVRHAFGFGSVVHPRAQTREGDDGDRYRRIVEKHFNKVSLESGFRWQNWFRGSEADRRRRLKELDETLNWMEQRGIEVRGHYLMWGPLERRWQPEHLLNKPAELRKAYFAHVEKKARWAGDRVAEWDAINHIIGWGRTYADVFGGPEIYAEVIRTGRKLAPHAEMWVNEGQILPGGGRREAYRGIIRTLIDRGAAPDGIGFMGHFRENSLTPPEEIHDVLDSYARLIPKLQLTEFDVDVGLDERLQADYLRDVMTVAFSHPAVEAVVMWGFWEGQHWRPDAALWRRDWSLKPAGQAWLDLVFKRWWTDRSGTTDAGGRFAVRGFLGRYEVTVEAAGKTLRKTAALTKSGLKLRFDVGGGG
jgi:GH35 family endo-1,4-beta-xylanase